MGRAHGWGGSPPTSDEEAVARILTATRDSIDRHGARVTVSDVAALVGVTRQTIYRYFPSTEALLIATGLDASGPFLGRLARRARDATDPVDAIVEGIVFTIEALPKERYLGLLLESGRIGARQITSDTSMTLGRALLGGVTAGWHMEGITDVEIDELIEWTLRILQSLLIDPGDPPRTGNALRAYLHRWLTPALRERLRPRPTQLARASEHD